MPRWTLAKRIESATNPRLKEEIQEVAKEIK